MWEVIPQDGLFFYEKKSTSAYYICKCKYIEESLKTHSKLLTGVGGVLGVMPGSKWW